MGMLILKKAFVDGYGLQGQISGTQQHGLRGGTENIPGIAGAAAAIIQNFKSRKQKNTKLNQMRELCITLLSKSLPIIPYSDFYDTGDLYEKLDKHGKALCILGPENYQQYLPSTLLISIIDYDKPFCNIKFKKALEQHGIIVSIGSACNTNSKNSSHVIQSIKAPPVVRRGVLRISFGDYNTTDEVKEFAKIFINAVKNI
jgi:cysteine desulfurase